MTTVQITRPDALAQEAANAGLFESAKMERLLRARLLAGGSRCSTLHAKG